MEEQITKEDLRQFGFALLTEIRSIANSAEKNRSTDIHPEWLKSRAVRKLLDMSAGSLQNLRVTGKIRHKKVLGSYYYNKMDLLKLFNE